MGDPVVISCFDAFAGPNEWAFLSNFYVGARLEYRTFSFMTGEHMFQAFKASSREDFVRLADAPSPAEAKANGKHYLRLRMDWERVKFDVMRLVLRTKFAHGREEAGLLLATGDALLIEGTTWGDRTWGVDLKAGRKRAADEGAGGLGLDGPWEAGEPWELSPGRNWLGALLMVRRAELVAEVRGAIRMPYGDVCRVAEDLPPGR